MGWGGVGERVCAMMGGGVGRGWGAVGKSEWDGMVGKSQSNP